MGGITSTTSKKEEKEDGKRPSDNKGRTREQRRPFPAKREQKE